MVSICLNVVFACLLKVSICLKKVLDFRNELILREASGGLFLTPGLGDIPADAGAFWYHHDDRISGPGGAPLAGIPPEIIPRHDEPGGR